VDYLTVGSRKWKARSPEKESKRSSCFHYNAMKRDTISGQFESLLNILSSKHVIWMDKYRGPSWIKWLWVNKTQVISTEKHLPMDVWVAEPWLLPSYFTCAIHQGEFSGILTCLFPDCINCNCILFLRGTLAWIWLFIPGL
jgi:hypothetical protein